MNAYRQAQYLHALQIPVWVSRKSVAPARQAVVDDDVETAKKASVESAVPVQSNIQSGRPARAAIRPPQDEQQSEVIQAAPPAVATAVEEPLPTYLLDEPPPVDEHALPELGMHEVVADSAPVFALQGEGPGDADCILLGNIAVAEETAAPFAANEEALLNNMLKAIHLSKQDVFTVKPLACLATLMRDPQEAELAACKDYLCAHIEKIQPKAILVMNTLVAQILLDTSQTIVQLSGHVHSLPALNTRLIVTYSPAHLSKRPTDKRKAWVDLKRLRQLLV